MKYFILISAMFFILVGCNTMVDETQTGTGEITGTWEVSQEVGTIVESPIAGDWKIDGKDVSVQFTSMNYNINAGCNVIAGEYSFSPDTGKITFGEAITTMMACEDEIMSLETEMMTAFSKINSYEIDGTTVELSGDDVHLTLETVAQWELQNTNWNLSQILIEEGFVSDVIFENSDLIFSQDWKISGLAVCNTLVGNYEVSDWEIQVSGLASTKKMCSEQEMKYESAIVAAFEQVNMYNISESTLTFLDADGATLLVYTAE